MKNFLVCIVLPFLVISCSTDSDFNNSERTNSIATEKSSNSKIPENQANPFDAKGKKYYELLDIYLSNNGVPNSIAEISNQIQFVPMNLNSVGYPKRINISISLEEITGIAEAPLDNLAEIVGTSFLSAEAKGVLMDFIKSLIDYKEFEYNAIYDHIVSYETAVTDNTLLNENEKEILLCITTLSRYSLYAESKHKDRDWEISVGNRKKQTISAIYGFSIVSIIASLR
jgi:hypothetical protein